MTTMDWSLMDRVNDGSISAKEAFMKSANKQAFQHLLKPGELEKADH
jgi:Tfp pilus assembly ATPase PilU